eukprot:7377657-Prymnesium_polylepis.1
MSGARPAACCAAEGSRNAPSILTNASTCHIRPGPRREATTSEGRAGGERGGDNAQRRRPVKGGGLEGESAGLREATSQRGRAGGRERTAQEGD